MRKNQLKKNIWQKKKKELNPKGKGVKKIVAMDKKDDPSSALDQATVGNVSTQFSYQNPTVGVGQE